MKGTSHNSAPMVLCVSHVGLKIKQPCKVLVAMICVS